MKNVPNIGGIHLLSGHLHGCEGKGRGRERLASWGDSSAGGWHVTAVTVLKGGGGGWRLAAPPDPITPHGPLSDPAAWLQPLCGRYWSLVRRTSCPPLQSSTAELSNRPAITPPLTPAIRAAIHSPANHPLKWLVKSGYGIQVKERCSCRECITSCDQQWWW